MHRYLIFTFTYLSLSTRSPSSMPSSSPTKAPTSSPSASPSASPTTSPTQRYVEVGLHFISSFYISIDTSHIILIPPYILVRHRYLRLYRRAVQRIGLRPGKIPVWSSIGFYSFRLDFIPSDLFCVLIGSSQTFSPACHPNIRI